ncbi:hypothetical protein [Bradyrhizobium sp. SYSU BS000235]|uniref:hypothetical protein n=1 Tax=Bradyrhizobium sp. SYSU BS000235 TaxID=3411332 RepID=UPI003C70EE69
MVLKFRPNTKIVLDYTLLAVFIAVSTWLLVGDMDIRLANISSDDGLTSYAYFLRYPNNFRLDSLLINFAPAGLASILNWLPALSFLYFDISPKFFHVLFLYAQNILLGIAIFRFTYVASRSREVAWVSALFFGAFRPHWWNLGLFADLDWMPYAGFFSLPMLILAMSFCLERKTFSSTAFLLIGGLIHPILGLFSAGIIAMYWVSLCILDQNVTLGFRRVGAIVLAVMLFVTPGLITTFGIREIPATVSLPMFLRNGHTIPWGNATCTYCMPSFLTGLVVTFAFVALAITSLRRDVCSRETKILFLSAVVVSVSAGLLHALGYYLGNVFLLRLIALRVTLILLCIATPIVIAVVWQAIRSNNIAQSLAGSFFLMGVSAPVAVGTALVLAPQNNKRDPNSARKWISTGVESIGFLLLVLLAARYLPKVGPVLDKHLQSYLPDATWLYYFLPPDRPTRWMWLLIPLLAAAPHIEKIFPGLHRFAKLPSAAILASVALALFTLRTNAGRGSAWTHGEAAQFAQVQLWARTSTEADASFITTGTSIYSAWRNYAHRPVIATYRVGSVYFFPEAAEEYNKKLYRIFAELLGMSEGDVRKEMEGAGYLDLYMRLTSPEFMKLVATIGGDFVVRRSSWPTLDFPVAYKNDAFVVYDLRQWSRSTN